VRLSPERAKEDGHSSPSIQYRIKASPRDFTVLSDSMAEKRMEHFPTPVYSVTGEVVGGFSTLSQLENFQATHLKYFSNGCTARS
jgi:hypothetical protein